MQLRLEHSNILFSENFPFLGENSRPWNNGEEYLLGTLGNQDFENLLVLNDRYGALTLGVKGNNIVSAFDSKASYNCTLENIRLNNKNIQIVSLSEIPRLTYQCVILSPPKGQNFLLYLASLAGGLLGEEGVLYIPVMDKHFPKTNLEVLKGVFEYVQPSRGWKKGRFITLKGFKGGSIPLLDLEKRLSYGDLQFINSRGSFSQGRIDQGTRFLLDHMKNVPYRTEVLDMACGDGLLGIVYKGLYPQSRVHFADVSHVSLKGVEYNLKLNNLEAESVLWSDGYEHAKLPPVDLILINPPYHLNSSRFAALGKTLLSQSLTKLKPGGEIWVIANHHLGYDKVLEKTFGNYREVSRNQKYHILQSLRRD